MRTGRTPPQPPSSLDLVVELDDDDNGDGGPSSSSSSPQLRRLKRKGGQDTAPAATGRLKRADAKNEPAKRKRHDDDDDDNPRPPAGKVDRLKAKKVHFEFLEDGEQPDSVAALTKVDRLKHNMVDFAFLDDEEDPYVYLDDAEGSSSSSGSSSDSDSGLHGAPEAPRRLHKRSSAAVQVEDDEEDDLGGFVVNDEGDDEEHAVTLPSQFARRLGEEDRFTIFLEYLYFAAKDPSFQRNLSANPKDALYWDNRLSVERRVQDLASQLGGGAHWDATALHYLQSWTKIHESSTVRDATVEKEQCQVCNRASAESFHMLSLYGRCYDARKMWSHTALELQGPAVKYDNEEDMVTLSVGVSCMNKAMTYHRLYHFKYNLYVELERLAEKKIRKDRSLKKDVNFLRLKDAVLTPEWKRLKFQVYTSLMAAAESLVLK